ncbi:MAG: terminase large subunit [Rhodospirillales bacterium]|nr:terminase large subunit [Rhodospirillales bacterium]
MLTNLERYLSRLKVTQGRLAGDPFTVLPWQRRFLRGAFKAGAATSALSVARGNGKTALLAGVACAAIDGPLMVPRGEVVIVAASYQQGRVAFDHARAFMGDKLDDKGAWRTWDTAQQAQIENRRTGAKLRVIGSDPRRAHGLAPFLVLADEPAQWPSSTGDRMRAALETALGKIPDSRLVALGTRPVGAEHWFAKMLEGGCDFAVCFAAGENDPPFQVRTWRRANPSLPHMPDLEAAIRREAKAAKSDPATLPAFRALRLNMGTSDVETALLLDAGTWQAIEGAADRPHDGAGACWGLDLGTSAAMSAVVAYWPPTGALEALAAFPHRPALAERGVRDGVGDLYVRMAARGELVKVGQNAVEIAGVLRIALTRFGPPRVIVADRWREAELRDALDAAQVPPCPLEFRGQGFKDGGADVREFRRACLEGKVTPAESLLMRAAMSEARVVMDPAGNSKLAKQTEGQRRLRARDDAAAAAILAVSAGVRQPVEPPRRWRSLGVVGG